MGDRAAGISALVGPSHDENGCTREASERGSFPGRRINNLRTLPSHNYQRKLYRMGKDCFSGFTC